MGKPRMILFARVGWMKRYAGGDERPVGGGKNNKNEEAQNERFNFFPIDGDLFGFVRTSGTMNLVRIQQRCQAPSLDGGLVIFLATNPDKDVPAGKRQKIVGWYKSASVLREAKIDPTGKRANKYTNLKTKKADAVLLPLVKRKHWIPQGKKGFPGTSNVTYTLDGKSGQPLRHRWITEAVRYVDEYRGPNSLDDLTADALPALEAELDAADGHQTNTRIRMAVEDRAMKMAEAFYRKQSYKVKNVSASSSWDLECTKGRKVLRVEVKGLQDVEGNRIILTGNEVEAASELGANMELLVVFNIKVEGEKKPRAKGGTGHRYERWDPRNHDLRPHLLRLRVVKGHGIANRHCRLKKRHTMTQAAEEILQKALELPEEDRDRIADKLWRSIHGKEDQSVEEAWADEAERRAAEVDAGEVETRPWSETLDKLQARLSH